jgi:HSP20 family molecular chaperone IbpA
MDFIVRTRLGFEPNADVYIDEDRSELVVVVEVAGADPESLRVWLEGRSLSITGARPERLVRRGSFIQKEIPYGAFAKRIRLPVAVDFVGDALAQYVEGVLVITLPVAAASYLPSTRTEIRMIVKRTLS